MAGDFIRYANQNATRRLPVNPRLAEAMSFLQQMGVSMEVFSGGQPAKGSGGARVGSVRHDHGNAADVFFHQNGRRLDWANPQDLPTYQDIVRKAKAAGLTGFGAGPGYMQPGSMHIGFGNPGVWGAGGTGRTAPGWLAEAYGETPARKAMPSFAEAQAGIQPTMANMQNKSFDPVGEVMASAGQPAPQAGGLASMFTPSAPTDATASLGMSAPGQSVVPNGLGGIALAFMQQQGERQKRREEEEQAEQIRRAALFSQEGVAGLYG